MPGGVAGAVSYTDRPYADCSNSRFSPIFADSRVKNRKVLRPP